MTQRWAQGWARGFGPAMARPALREGLRSGGGAALALALCGLTAFGLRADPLQGLFLIAPLGASAVLLFAVPNSPLAQPWSVFMGNVLSATAAVLVLMLPLPQTLLVGLAVGAAILVMGLGRALHPPGGAVALVAALSPDLIHQMGPRFILAPVAAGTGALVLLAILWNRLSGRAYPQLPAHAAPEPEAVLGLGAEALAGILAAQQQSANLGVEDLGRLIGAVEQVAAGRRLGDLTCADLMSRQLVTVLPETPLSDVAALFRQHGFASLPVVAANGRFLGVIYQIHLIRRAEADGLRLHRGFAAAMRRLSARREEPVTADQIMAVAVSRVTPKTPVAALLPLLAGSAEAVPVVVGHEIVGIVTRSDLIAGLAHVAASSVTG